MAGGRRGTTRIMKIEVHYFAAARELVGMSNEPLALVRPLTAMDLVRHLAQRHPRLAPYVNRMRVAINGEIVGDAAPVKDGDEVALLPPVAGGSALAEVRETALSVDELIEAVRAPAAGAIALFLGVVRDHAEGKAVSRLDYEAFTELANKEMRRIVDDLLREHPESKLAVVHRVGSLAIGDIAVIIAASAAHRGQAFELCRAAIDRIKASVPIWKKEWDEAGQALWVNLEADTRK
jgi:molybdopterin converting factor subunit 1